MTYPLLVINNASNKVYIQAFLKPYTFALLDYNSPISTTHFQSNKYEYILVKGNDDCNEYLDKSGKMIYFNDIDIHSNENENHIFVIGDEIPTFLISGDDAFEIKNMLKELVVIKCNFIVSKFESICGVWCMYKSIGMAIKTTQIQYHEKYQQEYNEISNILCNTDNMIGRMVFNLKEDMFIHDKVLPDTEQIDIDHYCIEYNNSQKAKYIQD